MLIIAPQCTPHLVSRAIPSMDSCGQELLDGFLSVLRASGGS